MPDTPPAPRAVERVISRIVVPDEQSMVTLLGHRDEVLAAVERVLDSDVHVRGNEITLTGSAKANAVGVLLFEHLLALLARGEVLTADAVERGLGMLRQGDGAAPADVLSLNILAGRGRTIRPKTANQRAYVEAIDDHTIVFGIGPAGTGKTYLAMAKAVQALQAKQVNRIILTRPAVEAGERLGFLPGTLYDKIDPYLRPLYDALHDMLDPESIPRLMAAGTIEVAPLAYMRGRAQPVDTMVMTPEGGRPIGALEVGDLVVGSDGLPTPVLAVHPQGRKPVYRVTTQDGASTLACGEHLWSVTTRSDKRHGTAPRLLETREMIGRLRRGHDRDLELPMVAPVEFVPTEVPMDPYALGLLLGDGCLTLSSPPSFSTRDPELALALGTALPDIELAPASLPGDFVLRHVGDDRGGLLTADPVTTVLRRLALAGTRSTTRHVPVDYLRNSAAVRLALLQGLLDTGGGPVVQAGRTCRVRYTTCWDRLRDDVVWLVRSLGGVAYVRKNELDIRLPAGTAPFRLARKQAAYDATGGGRPMRFVDSIEPAGEADCVCISVGAADSLYVTEDFLVTHNTLNDAFIILDEAQNTSAEQMKMFLTRLGFGSRIVVTGDVTQVDLPSGTTSGLRVVRGILEGIDDVHFATLTSQDVVRHNLVGKIVDAYAQFDAELEAERLGPRRTPGRRDDVRR